MSKNTLLEMLRYCRPDNTKGEVAFIKRFLLPLPGIEVDGYGNMIVRVGNSPILWSSHTDTVHYKRDKQKIAITDDGWIYSVTGDCLGADCGTGVYTMREMILRGVPGLYVFHRAEEVGGRGSSWIARNNKALFDGIKCAIALDRKGQTSVITHQFSSRCASDEFGNSLAAQLGETWTLDDGGTFTDTANYTDLVGECTNLSVGYCGQHTNREVQHLEFALALPDLLAKVNPDELVFKRQPGELDENDWMYGGGYHRFGGSGRGYTSTNNYSSVATEYDWVTENHNGQQVRVWRKLTALETKTRAIGKLLDAIEMHPWAAASILYEHGFSHRDIREYGYNYRNETGVEKEDEERVEDQRTSAY